MILDRILEAKRDEVASARASVPQSSLRASASYASARKGFAARLRQTGGRRIIAEIKRASPSKGVIRELFDPAELARDYAAGGAACISVLTDGPFFQGSLDDLRAARAACVCPLLRKDFVIDDYQITQAREAGADAVLLIVAALDESLLGDLNAAAHEESMDVLVEVHDEAELEIADRIGARLIGVNNRNLKTFETSIDVTRRLMALMPDDATVISESGLGDPAELADLERIGVAGFLIGETFMKSERPGATLASLISA